MVPVLPESGAFARESFTAGRPWLEAALELTRRIHDEFSYDPKATTVTTQVSEVLEHKRGVCQDFAHLMLSCLRSLGLPARYVSGYVLNYVPEGKKRLSGADASHAWVAAHCPELGWVAFDPTNGKLCGPGVRHPRLGPGVFRYFAVERRGAGRRDAEAFCSGQSGTAGSRRVACARRCSLKSGR